MMTQESSQGNRSQPFNICNHLDKLTSDGGSHGPNERSYHCPLCNAQNFKVTIAGPKAGKYFTHGCTCMDTDTGKQRIIDTLSPRWEKPVREAKEATYTYDGLEDGSVFSLCQVKRTDDGNGNRKFWQQHWNGQKWERTMPDNIKAKIHLYRIFQPINQDAIKHGEPILIVEGEGKVNALHDLGIAATCAIGAAGKWTDYGYPNYLKDLEGAVVVICPDRDKPGIKHAEMIAKDFPEAPWIYANPTSFMWDRIPENKGYDLSDWISDGATKEQILGAIEPRRTKTETITTLPPVVGEKQEKRSQADQLLDLALSANIEFFITPDKTAYADIQDGAIRRTLPLNKQDFRQWLRFKFYEVNRKGVSNDAMQQTLETLKDCARFTGKTREVHLRTAEHEGRVYIDLGTDSWEAIEVSSDGWRVVRDAPVRFRRTDGMLPLPMPIANGRVEDLQELLNIPFESWVIVLSWLIRCIKPAEEYPIVIVYGPAGAGKTITTEVLKSMVDPATVPLIPSVGDLRNFAVTAMSRHMIAIDNLSGLSHEQSDALCRTSTGAGYTHRTLGSDADETTFSYCRPLILNGIDSVATREDLLRRCFLVKLQRPKARMSKAKLRQRREQIAPGILGGLCDLLSKVLNLLPDIEGTYESNAESFVDFIELGLAVEKAMTWEPGTFLNVIEGTREEAHQTALDASPVGQAVQSLMSRSPRWEGTMTELLYALRGQTEESIWKSKYFPRDATRLSSNLDRLVNDLGALGINFHSRRTKKGSLITLEYEESATPATPAPSNPYYQKVLMGVAEGVASNSQLHQLHPILSPENEATAKGVAVNVSGVASNFSATPLEPLPRKAGVAGVAGVAEKCLHSERDTQKPEIWKKWVSIDTLVRVLEEKGDESLIRVPGMSQVKWVDSGELTEGDE